MNEFWFQWYVYASFNRKKMKILTTENQSLPLLYKRMNYFQKPTFKIISYNVLIKCVGGTMLGGD